MSQQRIGRDGRMFDCLKFRSMTVGAEQALPSASDPEWQAMRKLTHDPRVTSLGRLLRRSSLDELPQLFNVLLGDMSIVGPRPHALYSRARNKLFWEVDQRYGHRHACKPGILASGKVGMKTHAQFEQRGNPTLEFDLPAGRLSRAGDHLQ